MSAGVEASQAAEDTGFYFFTNAAKLSSYGQNVGGLIIIIDLEEPPWHLRMEMMHTTGGISGELQMRRYWGITDDNR